VAWLGERSPFALRGMSALIFRERSGIVSLSPTALGFVAWALHRTVGRLGALQPRELRAQKVRAASRCPRAT